MSSVPRLLTRNQHQVEMVLHNSPDIAAWKFLVADTLDHAFSAPNTMFTLVRGTIYKSKTLKRNHRGTMIYQSRGLSFAQYDPEDFWVGGGTYPHDANVSFVSLQEQNMAGVFRPAGPILVVPPPNFFTNTRPSLVIAGTAPNVAATTTGVPPAGALWLALPRYADSVTITNNGGASIFISFGPGMVEFEVLDEHTTILPEGVVTEMLIRGEGATVTFSAALSIVNAEMA